MAPEALPTPAATDAAVSEQQAAVKQLPASMAISHGKESTAMPSQQTAAAFKAKMQVVAPEQHQLSEVDKKKLTSQLANLHGQASKVYMGQTGVTQTISEADIKTTETLFFKDCTNCDYTLTSSCTKLIIQSCKQFTLRLPSSARILTHILEAWSCEKLTIDAAIDIRTYQIDLSEHVSLTVDDRAHFQQLIWASTEDLAVTFKKCGSVFKGGVKEMQAINPTVRKDFDQFILRFVKNKMTNKDDLLNEMIVRLENGYPTTEREARQFEERQEENLQTLAKKLLGENVVIGPPKNKAVKVGRNDKCICGSTKKYKACCGTKVY